MGFQLIAAETFWYTRGQKVSLKTDKSSIRFICVYKCKEIYMKKYNIVNLWVG